MNSQREIKFRVWDNQHKVFIRIKNDITLCTEYMNLCFAIDTKDYKKADQCLSVTVQQYTGLKDKNGKEIYEGDIFSFEYPNKECNFLGVVTFGDYDNGGDYEDHSAGYGWYIQRVTNLRKYDFPQFAVLGSYPSVHEGYVVGNIYENKDLLSGVVE